MNKVRHPEDRSIKDLGLYVHIPFCARKCHYCNFVIAPAGGTQRQDDFLKALEKEASRRAPDFEEETFDTLYIGGGTPSTLGPRQTERFFGFLRRLFRFREDAEITYEINPESVDSEKALVYRRLGINRASLGAQSFDDRTLKQLNRAHGVKEIFHSFERLRNAGFDNINLDLILSLPNQTLSQVEHSLRQVIALGPEHVSIYDLTIEDKTVFGQWKKQGRLSLPPEEEQIRMLELAQPMLAQNGIVRYELLNYARPGFESRHNLLYWANEEYLGLGPGAFSYRKGKRFRYADSYQSYLTKIQENDWTHFEEETLTPQKRQIESFLLALRLAKGADLERFKSLIPKLVPTLASLEEKGLLAKKHGAICLTQRGQLLAETVFSELSLLE
jgi:oxygen-independent coproporphyrinogen-3 oxidase